MRALHFLLAIAAARTAIAARAQADWPGHEVRIIIGFSAGGTTDIITRTWRANCSRRRPA